MRAEKRLFTVLILSVAAILGAEEVVHLSRLDRPAKELTIHRDLFRPGRNPAAGTVRTRPMPNPVEPLVDKNASQDLESRIRRSIVFEGFIRRNDRLTAILSVDGEYFVAAQGEQVMGDVSVAALNEKRMVVLVDGKRHEIPFQGVDENEQ
ncbi:MAG: hypothetical protein JXA62_03030 [Candidatus Aminicenantes bacterium]|nr:hypothetical protein [Candidatus Aminicenantes bacterium]